MVASARPLLMTMVILALGACGRSAAPSDGASCYPAAARPWITAAADPSSPAPDPGGPYSIYVDGSASMVGYLRGATATEKPLADLVDFLPDLHGVESRGKVELVRFDRNITVIDAAGIKRLQTDAGYVCPAGNPRCDAQESHLDQALDRVANADPNRLSVIVSDLWLTNSEVRTTEGVALSRPLGKILGSGRAVAVYGFESPYSGRVFDLPSGNTSVIAKRRYLFAVAVGPLARLDAFHAAMLRAPSASIQNDLAAGRAHHALFTTEPVRAAAVGTQTFGQPAGSALTHANFLTVRSGVRIPQFKLERSAALRTGADAAATAQWQGVPATAIRSGAVWEGDSRGRTQLFRMATQSCKPDGGDWRADGQLEGGWQQAAFAIRPGDLATLASGTYLLVGDVQRMALQSSNPATQWLRDWSFDPAGEAGAVARPVMPTLNLSEVARLMENALAQAAETRPVHVGGFAVAVQVN